jgi:hypothetical protein
VSARGPGRWLAITAAVAMAAAVGSGLWILGTPGHQRDLRLDARRVQDLRELSTRIGGYWMLHQKLPPELAQLNVNPAVLRDPLTGAPYAYKVDGKARYHLCAHFKLATPDAGGRDEPLAVRPLADDDSWRHPAGRHCFERSVKQ